jgi:hypothetical protein
MKTKSGTRFFFTFHRCAGAITLEENFTSSAVLDAFKSADMPALSNAIRPFEDGNLAIHVDFGHPHKSAGFFTDKDGRNVVGHIYLINEGRKNGHRGRRAVKKLQKLFKPEKADVEELTWEFA